MKFVLVLLLLLACSSGAIKAQSCLTDDDVKQMIARVDSPPPKLDKKLKEELVKMAERQRELLVQVVENDQKKQSDNEKLHKSYDEHIERLCQIIKTNGWPTTALVDQDGVNATYHILKNAGSYDLQRDLLPVIVAVIKKDPVQK